MKTRSILWTLVLGLGLGVTTNAGTTALVDIAHEVNWNVAGGWSGLNSPCPTTEPYGTEDKLPGFCPGSGPWWNILQNATGRYLLADDGSATGWLLAVIDGPGGNEGSGTQPGAGAPAPLDWQPAYDDGVWTRELLANADTYVLSGLAANTLYQLTLWGSKLSGWSWSDGLITITKGAGSNATLMETTALTVAITSTAAGEIEFVLSKDGSHPGNMTGLNTFSIEEIVVTSSCADLLAEVFSTVCGSTLPTNVAAVKALIEATIVSTVTGPTDIGSEQDCEDWIHEQMLSEAACLLLGALLD